VSDGTERRGEPREPLTLKVEYADADDLASDYTVNLSKGGIFVLTEREFEIGDQVKLVISFPGLIRPVPLAGVVKWLRGKDEGESGIGVEFATQADLERINALMQSITRHEPGIVARVLDVLVVEDNPHVAQLIRDGLTGGARRELGDRVTFRFHNATNGKEALAILRTAKLDLVIIDIYLPVLDGAQVIKQARSDGTLRATPIIAMSAGGKAARESALAAGADFFLDKPMRLADIISTMRRLTGLS
jgi:uncharacterized protein (TIGR02266 family)